MSAVAEEERIKHLFDNIETVEEVAETFDKGDVRRRKLLDSARGVLAEVGPIRPRIAAHLLDLSERTVRSWVSEGVLTRALGPSRRLLLDPVRLHDVMHLVRDLRLAGRERNLIEAVWHRLSDRALLERSDIAESLAQMRRGEGRVLRQLPDGEGQSAA